MKRITVKVFCFVLACVAFDVQAFVIGPTSPGKWGDPTFGTGATITWSLIETTVSCPSYYSACTESTTTPLSSFLPLGYEAEIQRAFDTWAAVADLTFIQVTDGGGTVNFEPNGDIRIGGIGIDGPYNILARAYYPPTNGFNIAGDMFLDKAENWTIGDTGFDLFTIVLHELGHSLGLGHSDVPGAVMGAYYGGAVTGLHADDIAGIQYIYGAVPLPMAAWLMLSGLGFLSLVARRGATA